MKRPGIKKGKIIISLGLTLVILAVGMSVGDPLGIGLVGKKLLLPMVRLMLTISLGLVAGQILEATGWTEQLSVFARPFFRLSNLGNRCSAAFTTAFISGVASNAMLLEFFNEKKITKTQLFLTNYMNQLPAFFVHLPTTFFIIVPLTGRAGVLYLALTFGAALLRTACIFLFGFFYTPLRATGGEVETISPRSKKSRKGVIQEIWRKLPGRVTGIAVYVLPIYTLVFMLNRNGFFDFLNQEMSHALTFSFMPVESLSVVVLSFAAEFTSGFATAGALLDAGVLTTKQTVIALLMGNVIAFPLRALRHQLPHYMGIFSPGMGIKLLISGQLFRVASIIIIGLIYYKVA